MAKAKKKAAKTSRKTPRAVAKGAARTSRVAAQRMTDHVRIVPLHHPKPMVAYEDLAHDDHDLYDGKVHTAPTNAQLVYNDGPLLTAVEVYTIFWGKSWQANSKAAALMKQINDFFKDIMKSSLITQMNEYSVPGKKIGFGSFVGTKVVTAAAPVKSITDTQVATTLKKWLASKVAPKGSANRLYFIYLEPGIVSIMGGSKSCQNYCGYHNHTGSIYYAVMPYPTCAGCLGGMSVIDAITGTSSHELCEAITDPVPGSGWYDQVNGEIGDICAWSFKKIGNWTVQLEWSNQQGKCV